MVYSRHTPLGSLHFENGHPLISNCFGFTKLTLMSIIGLEIEKSSCEKYSNSVSATFAMQAYLKDPCSETCPAYSRKGSSKVKVVPKETKKH